MSVYTLRAIRATPEPTIESFFYSLQEILADLKEKYALFLAAYNACYCGCHPFDSTIQIHKKSFFSILSKNNYGTNEEH